MVSGEGCQAMLRGQRTGPELLAADTAERATELTPPSLMHSAHLLPLSLSLPLSPPSLFLSLSLYISVIRCCPALSLSFYLSSSQCSSAFLPVSPSFSSLSLLTSFTLGPVFLDPVWKSATPVLSKRECAWRNLCLSEPLPLMLT